MPVRRDFQKLRCSCSGEIQGFPQGKLFQEEAVRALQMSAHRMLLASSRHAEHHLSQRAAALCFSAKIWDNTLAEEATPPHRTAELSVRANSGRDCFRIARWLTAGKFPLYYLSTYMGPKYLINTNRRPCSPGLPGPARVYRGPH